MCIQLIKTGTPGGHEQITGITSLFENKKPLQKSGLYECRVRSNNVMIDAELATSSQFNVHVEFDITKLSK